MTRRSKGFIAIPLAGYAAIAALIIIGGLGLALKIQAGRLDDCKAQVAVLADRIAIQNAAIERLKAASDAKMADASKSLQDATSRTQKAVDESARLKRLASQPRQPDKPRDPNCPPSPAERAVQAVRQGL